MNYDSKIDSNVNNLVKSHLPLRERATPAAQLARLGEGLRATTI
jgi:hypothetical protein